MDVLICLSLAAACRTEPAPPTAAIQKGVTTAETQTSISPAVRPGSKITAKHPAPEPATQAPAPHSEAKPESPTSAKSLVLKPIVKRMFARELFQLEPSTVQAYFADLAALQAEAEREDWQRQFAGRSKLPWIGGVYVELLQDDERWGLGHASIAWTPPKEEARALYDRLLAEIRAARGRKPDFGNDESTPGRDQRLAGWSWCKDQCQATLRLHAADPATLGVPVQLDDTQTLVLLSVFVPEGP